jgi:hypothetical protein
MSYATGTASGLYTDVGGLVGYNTDMVEMSYATGTVNGPSDDIGGLVGQNDGTVETSFATGAVTGSSSGQGGVGGLVGLNNTDATVETCYATGPVSGVYYNGGLVGDNTGTVETSYWANDVGGNGSLTTFGLDTLGTVDSYTSGETLASMAHLNTFTPAGTGVPNWDFANTWTTYGNTTTPQLIGLPPANQVLVITLDPLLPISPGNPGDPSVPVFNAFNTITTTDQTGAGSVIVDTLHLNIDIVPGGSGAASADDQLSAGDLRRKLAASGKNIDASLEIIRNDLKDGSTVNTGTLASKWAENTGFSEIVHVDGYAQISRGLTQPEFNDPLVLKLFEQQSNGSVLNDLSHAASGH